MIDVFKLISSLWDIELKFSKENLWIWEVEEIYYLYGHYCQFMSLLWLFMQIYLKYEVYMISIMKLMMYMKCQNPILTLCYDPLRSMMLMNYPIDYLPLWPNVKEWRTYVIESWYWLKIYVEFDTLTIEFYYYFFYISVDVLESLVEYWLRTERDL